MKKRETDQGIHIELEEGDLPASFYTHRLPIGQVWRGRGSKVVIQIEEAAVEILGEHGRLLSMSKSAYADQYPDHTVYYNACVFDGRRLGLRKTRARQIWFGDLDLTLEAGKLQELADRVGSIVVTPEMPYRFQGLPRWPARLDKHSHIRVFRGRQGQNQ